MATSNCHPRDWYKHNSTRVSRPRKRSHRDTQRAASAGPQKRYTHRREEATKARPPARFAGPRQTPRRLRSARAKRPRARGGGAAMNDRLSGGRRRLMLRALASRCKPAKLSCVQAADTLLAEPDRECGTFQYKFRVSLRCVTVQNYDSLLCAIASLVTPFVSAEHIEVSVSFRLVG